MFILHLDVQGSWRHTFLALSLFNVRSTFVCCMFGVSFSSLGDRVVLETFKMGHGTNILPFLFFCDSRGQEHGTGECLLGLSGDSNIFLHSFLNQSETQFSPM